MNSAGECSFDINMLIHRTTTYLNHGICNQLSAVLPEISQKVWYQFSHWWTKAQQYNVFNTDRNENNEAEQFSSVR